MHFRKSIPWNTDAVRVAMTGETISVRYTEKRILKNYHQLQRKTFFEKQYCDICHKFVFIGSLWVAMETNGIDLWNSLSQAFPARYVGALITLAASASPTVPSGRMKCSRGTLVENRAAVTMAGCMNYSLFIVLTLSIAPGMVPVVSVEHARAMSMPITSLIS